MVRPVILILISITFGLIGLLLWRSALTDVGGFRLETASIGPQLAKLLATWKFWLGALTFVGIVLISLDLWANEELSQVIPLYSLSYVALALIGHFFLGEDVGPQRWAGILAIVAGVVLLVRS